MYQVDTAFIIFESEDLDAALEEAKSVSTYRTHNTVRQKAIDKGFSFDKGGFLDHRRNVTTRWNKEFKGLFEETSAAIAKLTMLYRSKKLPFQAWTQQVKAIVREAYRDAYILGLRSSGAGFSTHPFGKTEKHPPLSRHDIDFIDSAYRHEMRYLTRLMNQIREGTQFGEILKRMSAYSEALKHMYYSGRVVGSPQKMVIDWLSPLDRNTCASCRYLAGKSPFTKKSLPTTPRAGDTRCLNNCRCRLVMRSVQEATLRNVERSRRSKEYYLGKLKDIKAGKSVV